MGCDWSWEMSLREDFEKAKKSGMTEEAYLRQIWDETELVGDDFDGLDLDDLADDTDALAAVMKERLESTVQSSERKAFYERRCDRCLYGNDAQEEFETFIDELCNGDASEEAVRENLAHFFMRALRGELSADDRHRSIANANAVIGEGRIRPWQMRLERLFRCDS